MKVSSTSTLLQPAGRLLPLLRSRLYSVHDLREGDGHVAPALEVELTLFLSTGAPRRLLQLCFPCNGLNMPGASREHVCLERSI